MNQVTKIEFSGVVFGRVTQRVRLWSQIAVLAGLSCTFHSALATEDTGTPGAGRWEINLDVNGSRSSEGWQFNAPSTDFNYGWGDNVQLMAGLPWVIVHPNGQDSRSGLGAGTLGVKWRFVEQEKAGFSMSTFPQFTWNVLQSSVRRGIVAPGKQWRLPLQAGIELGEAALYAEAGRNFIEGGPHESDAGIKLTYPCLSKVECRLELQRSLTAEERQTLLSVGVKWKLSESLIVKALAGRDIGASSAAQRNLVFSFGLQFLR